jgi:hypothetical protein
MKTTFDRLLLFAACCGLVAGLFGCGGDGDGNSSPVATYDVKLTNLTANQPMAPIAAILHGQGFTAWQVGATARDGLEQLAEGGDPGSLLAEAAANLAVRDWVSGHGIVPPGSSDTVALTGRLEGAQLSVASMLVNTNDAFTGTTGQSLDDLQVGQSMTIDMSSYDAGTEDNSETASSVPGPVAGGEGYNPARDDRDFVTVHPGVVSADDGLAVSALDESHRFQNPAAQLVITRIR